MIRFLAPPAEAAIYGRPWLPSITAYEDQSPPDEVAGEMILADIETYARHNDLRPGAKQLPQDEAVRLYRTVTDALAERYEVPIAAYAFPAVTEEWNFVSASNRAAIAGHWAEMVIRCHADWPAAALYDSYAQKLTDGVPVDDLIERRRYTATLRALRATASLMDEGTPAVAVVTHRQKLLRYDANGKRHATGLMGRALTPGEVLAITDCMERDPPDIIYFWSQDAHWMNVARGDGFAPPIVDAIRRELQEEWAALWPDTYPIDLSQKADRARWLERARMQRTDFADMLTFALGGDQ